jgi:hypothetical protein
VINKMLGLVFLLSIISTGYCSDQAFKLTIKSDKNSYNMGDAILISYRLENISQKSARIFAWGGIFDLEKQYVNLFEIKNATGQEFEWTGPLVERPFPSKKDYVVIKPGEFLENTYRLNSFYNINSPGNYLIQCNKSVFGVSSNIVTIEILKDISWSWNK